MTMTSAMPQYIDAAVSVIRGAETEIMLFFIAIVLHMLLFTKHTIKGNAKEPKIPKSGSRCVAESTSRQSSSPSQAGVFQVRNALRDGNWKLAASELKTLGSVSQSMPKQMLQSLGRLAVEGDHTDELLSLMAETKMQSPGDFNVVLEACMGSKAYSAALEVFNHATAAGAADVESYSAAIKAHLQRRELGHARSLLSQMKTTSLRPNSYIVNELLDSFVTDSERCWEVFTQARELGVEPTAGTYSILLKSMQSRPRVMHVDRVLKAVEAGLSDMDEVLMISLIEACIRVDRTDLLWKLLEQQRTNKQVPMTSPHAYGSIVRAYGYVGDVKGVWDTWREMRTRRIPLTSVGIGCMVEALASNGDPEAAYEMIREIVNDESTRSLMNSVIYGSVLKGFSHLKNTRRMWTVYNEMVQEGVQLSITTYNILVDACARNSDMGRVPTLLEQMNHQQIEPNVITYSAIVKGYCSDRRLDKAFELFEEMKRLKHSTPDEHTYNTLISGCANQGLYERGIGVLADMEAAQVPLSNFTLSVLVKLCARSRRIEEAFDLCSRLSEAYTLKPNIHVYNNLINACLLQRDLKRALETVERATKERVRTDTRTYTLLLRGCLEAHALDDLRQLLRGAVGLTGNRITQPQGGLPVDFVEELIVGISNRCGAPALARELLEEIKTLREYSKLSPAILSR